LSLVVKGKTDLPLTLENKKFIWEEIWISRKSNWKRVKFSQKVVLETITTSQKILQFLFLQDNQGDPEVRKLMLFIKLIIRIPQNPAPRSSFIEGFPVSTFLFTSLFHFKFSCNSLFWDVANQLKIKVRVIRVKVKVRVRVPRAAWSCQTFAERDGERSHWNSTFHEPNS
jgi:hypothetical protein